jgi:DNA-binding response OmpR family regulator
MHPPRSSNPKPRLEVLTINWSEHDCSALENILSHSNWKFHCAHTLAECASFLRQNTVPVVICHCDIPGGDWKDVVSLARELPVPARVLVYSAKADDQFWMEVLESGGYDVLPKPFHAPEVYRLVTLAAHNWRKEAEQRDRPVLLHSKAGA